jgi:hypothetical protein
LLPDLEFFEVSNVNDDAIVAMHTSPNRFPDRCISNAGFERLVFSGVAKNLVAISVRKPFMQLLL